MNLIKLNRKHYMDKVLTPPDFRPTCAEEAELLGRRRWSLLLSWEPTTDWSCSSWCEVRISPPMGGKRSGCLRRLSTSVCLSVGAVTIPYRETQRDRESVNAIFSVCSLRYSTHQQEILFLLIWLLLLLAQSPLHNNPIPCDAITIISLTFTQVSFSNNLLSVLMAVEQNSSLWRKVIVTILRDRDTPAHLSACIQNLLIFLVI